MGCKEWNEKIPTVGKTLALICLLINVIWSGIGTIIIAVANEAGFEQCSFIIGIVQWFTQVFFFFGKFWAIWWGWLAYQKAS